MGHRVGKKFDNIFSHVDAILQYDRRTDKGTNIDFFFRLPGPLSSRILVLRPLGILPKLVSKLVHISKGLKHGFAGGFFICSHAVRGLGVTRWPSGWDAGLAMNRSRVRIPASPLSSATLGKLLTHMCLCHQAV